LTFGIAIFFKVIINDSGNIDASGEYNIIFLKTVPLRKETYNLQLFIVGNCF
jgi:hypothetical protein